MRRLAVFAIVAAVISGLTFWFLSQPVTLTDEYLSSLASLTPDEEAGKLVFAASGCSSCHSAKGATGNEKLMLGGGHRLETPFGVFVTPNISPDEQTGIGNWTLEEFANATIAGVSPQGSHYYPSFPYVSYRQTKPQDVVDLFAFLKTLPPVSRANEPHELALPFRWRRPLGVWKKMFGNATPVLVSGLEEKQLARGRYLVETLGHCAECHTPRNLLGGMETSFWLSGGPSPEGKGTIPNITPHETGLGSWSADDIAYYLESGFTPDYDFVGGSMVSVQENISQLPKSDREAIAKYLKTIPQVASP